MGWWVGLVVVNEETRVSPLPYVCLLSVCTLRRCPGQPGKGWMTRQCQSGNTNCRGFVGIYLGIGMTLNAGNVLQMQNWEISVQ